MPAQLDQSARELLLLLAGSVLFALAGLLLGATPTCSALWQRFRRALMAHPSVARVSGLLGLAALPIAGGLLLAASPFPAPADDTSALFSATLFALGILGLIVGQAGEVPRAAPAAVDTDGAIGPTSATIATFNAKGPAPTAKSRAA